MSAAPYDPYSFFGHLDRDVFIMLMVSAFLLLIYAIYGNVFLLIGAVLVFLGLIIVQIIRNNRRRIRYKYEPNNIQPADK